MRFSKRPIVSAAAAMLLLGACQSGFDPDFRNLGDGLDTSDAAIRSRAEERPTPDSRGVITYPTYQVAVAQPEDTVSAVATRVGLPPEEVASYNALPVDAPLRRGEIIALPRRVAGTTVVTASPATAATPRGVGQVDVATIAGNAIDRAGGVTSTGTEPVRHRVAPGETAFSIARRYGVSVDALAQWNGLDAARNVRVGQYLLIPPAAAAPVPVAVPPSRPGEGTATPTPPSAAQPLPEDDTAEPAPEPPAPPVLAEEATEASDTARLLTPVPGSIIRGYSKGSNDGIDISARAGTAVRAADAGTVGAITNDTDGVPIVVIRHEGNLLTVYAGVDNVSVSRGDTVSRGQTIGVVRSADPAVLHFEVREGFESVDPGPYLN
ncbi:peptidoglycan DD-metalloendopeptidase family protein [Roseitranquillus sediminis]|uniref:peptidoglycan DD-metalloendopeptidase family protein n=1 Tax=Roseitranquillus sediminis TaxID=2809051 RepID=UPI001D0CC17C|nr:peptidoglycan DD-metalloendopeptidase family protein [Roseitranquillus sediminis]MBM9594084.1 peptidoglycan DD-metalloendopeptidase family protein [Roseitranquillus sediminis]